MRISTNTIFEMGSGKIGDMTLAMFKTQQQIASGLRICRLPMIRLPLPLPSA